MSRPRIRTIKPEFFADERVNSLPVPGRYLTLGLITRADDRGRQRRQEAAIAAHVFPEADVPVKTVVKLLDAIVGAKIALGYDAGGHKYLWLPNFWKHQRINRPSESELPAHPDDPHGPMNIGDAMQAFKESSSINHPQFTESSVSPHHSPARPFLSVPAVVVELPVGLSRERVTEVCSILATVERWAGQINEVGVENALASEPNIDAVQAARLAATWGSDPSWGRGPAATLASALGNLAGKKPKADAKADRVERDLAALKSVMA